MGKKKQKMPLTFRKKLQYYMFVAFTRPVGIGAILGLWGIVTLGFIVVMSTVSAGVGAEVGIVIIVPIGLLVAFYKLKKPPKKT